MIVDVQVSRGKYQIFLTAIRLYVRIESLKQYNPHCDDERCLG